MISLALFRINVESFIESGSVINCDLPDEDGVVRNHCVVITEPIQGTGNSIHGAEFDYRQGFTFLPGLLSNTGMEVNATYAPSDSGQFDLAGNAIPFQDNSTKSGNLILWYQDKKFQARVALNYRSRRAVSEDVGAIAGLEMYQAPTKYLDASLSYNLSQVRRGLPGRNQPHQRVPAVLPGLARPGRRMRISPSARTCSGYAHSSDGRMTRART